MRIRCRETDQTADVDVRPDKLEGLILTGRGNQFYPEDSTQPDPDAEWIVFPDEFEEFELVEASDDERRQLQDAGFPFD